MPDSCQLLHLRLQPRAVGLIYLISMPQPSSADSPRWLILIHQIPPKPNYFRAKVGRRLQRVGAVAIKNSVYVLPVNEQHQEDLQWIAREIAQEGGVRPPFAGRRSSRAFADEQIESLFQTAREADYAQVAEEARALDVEIPRKVAAGDERRGDWEGAVARFRKRFAEIGNIDFGAPGREPPSRRWPTSRGRLERHVPKKTMLLPIGRLITEGAFG